MQALHTWRRFLRSTLHARTVKQWSNLLRTLDLQGLHSFSDTLNFIGHSFGSAFTMFFILHRLDHGLFPLGILVGIFIEALL